LASTKPPEQQALLEHEHETDATVTVEPVAPNKKIILKKDDSIKQPELGAAKSSSSKINNKKQAVTAAASSKKKVPLLKSKLGPKLRDVVVEKIEDKIIETPHSESHVSSATDFDRVSAVL
jgi:hypothetical protein